LKANENESIKDSSGVEVSLKYVTDCYAEYAILVNLLSDFESGIFVIGLNEYRKLPHCFKETIRIWKTVKAEIAKDRERK
jgi:hypothetical protein